MVLQSEKVFLALMNYIVKFCDKTIKEKHNKFVQTDCIRKTKLEKAEYEEIQKAILSNETKKKFYINISWRNTTTTLNTNPNLLLLRANI